MKFTELELKGVFLVELDIKKDGRGWFSRIFCKKEFDDLGTIAKAKGFLLVSSSPLTRSSYHADEDFAQLQQNRLNKH